MSAKHEGALPSLSVGAARAAYVTALLSIVVAGQPANAVDVIRGRYDAERVCFEVTLSQPSPLSDEWEFQFFFDTDIDVSTGYGPGYDFLVRGVGLGAVTCSRSPSEVAYVGLYATEEGNGPGGWGEPLRTVSFLMPDDRHLTACLPLGIGDLVDGAFSYAFEVYHDRRLVEGVYNQWTQSGGPPNLDACLIDEVDLNGDGVPDTTTGDVNNDGFIDLRDYAALLDCYGRPITSGASARDVSTSTCAAVFDYDGDRAIDIGDLAPFLVCPTGPS